MNSATTEGGADSRKEFSIATWNVNSLRVRGEQVLQWLRDVQPDVLALQETKMQDPDFPHPEPLGISEPDNPNFTDAFNYADLDSLIELYGHVRAENPTMQVNFRRASLVGPDDLSAHVVLLGGVA